MNTHYKNIDVDADAVLFDYLSASPGANMRALAEWIARYPQYERELTDATIDLVVTGPITRPSADDPVPSNESLIRATMATRVAINESLYPPIKGKRTSGPAPPRHADAVNALQDDVADGDSGQKSPAGPSQDAPRAQDDPRRPIASPTPQDRPVDEEYTALSDTLARSLWLPRAIAAKILDGQIDWDTLPDSVYAETYPYITPLSRARAEGSPIPNHASPGSEHFFVAVRGDPDMTPEQRTYWLSQAPQGFQ